MLSVIFICYCFIFFISSVAIIASEQPTDSDDKSGDTVKDVAAVGKGGIEALGKKMKKESIIETGIKTGRD